MTLDPLDELIVDEDAAPDNTILAELLKDKISLGKSGKILFSEEFHKLTHPKKILIYLLGRKAAIVKGLLSEKESVMPTKIGNDIMIDGKVVHARLTNNLKGIVKKEKEGYTVPNFNLLKCKKFLDTQKENEND